MASSQTKHAVTSPHAEWSGAKLRAALAAIVTHFRRHVPSLNALNVFPVPDGDTGTNMLLTLEAAAQSAQRTDDTTVGSVLAQAAHGALLGARGNSGVILFQLFRGLAQAANNAVTLDAQRLTNGIAEGARLAYQAVLHPVEGTMLTVLRDSAAAAQKAFARGCTLAEVLLACRDAAVTSVQKTPELLPILRQAGVVDAGGQGLAVIFDAAAAFAAECEPVLQPPEDITEEQFAQAMTFLDDLETLHGHDAFGYCVNFLLLGKDLPLEEIQQHLEQLGRSVVLVGDQHTLKIHVHTDHPGQLLEAALAFGELDAVRIDNMSAQTRELRMAREEKTNMVSRSSSRSGLLAIVPSPQLAKLFASLGAATLRGGPSMVPSAEEIAQAIRELPHSTVIVLPNDPNIATTARHAVQLVPEKRIVVLPVNSIPHGLAAATAFQPDADADDVTASLMEAIRHVRAIAITRATRDFAGPLYVQAGHWFAIVDDAIVASTPDFITTALAAFSAARADNAELATLLVGQEAPSIDALIDVLRTNWPELEVEVIEGAQPYYPLLASLE